MWPAICAFLLFLVACKLRMTFYIFKCLKNIKKNNINHKCVSYEIQISGPQTKPTGTQTHSFIDTLFLPLLPTGSYNKDQMAQKAKNKYHLTITEDDTILLIID